MKGIIILDSLTQDVWFDKIPSQTVSYSDVGGIKQVSSIDWEDFVFKTNKPIDKTISAKPFILFFNDENIIIDRNSFYKSCSANMEEKPLEYEYTIGLTSPEIIFGLKETEEYLDNNIIHLIKLHIIRKRLKQNL